MTPADYPEFGRFVAALATDLRDNLARGAFADWLDEQGFLGEAGAVRALAGFRWMRYPYPGILEFLSSREDDRDLGWVHPTTDPSDKAYPMTWRVFVPDGGNWWWQGTDLGGVVSNKANVVRCLVLNPAWATPPVPA